MARKLRSSALESRTSRLKLPVCYKPFSGPGLARGVKLLYRRNKTNGTWVLKASDGHGAYWTKAFALADDYEDSDGKSVLTFYQAQDAAKKLARGEDGSAETAPITVDGALKAYERDLEARGAEVFNARHPRGHLTSTLLAKPVALLTATELRRWRDGLLAKMKPSSVVRTCKGLKAALALAAKHDARIQTKAWEAGLEALPDSTAVRNVILTDAQVRAFVAAAYARDPQLGLFIEVLAGTGTRPSQASRLLVEDLHGGERPKLSMPKSGKGNTKDRAGRRSQRVSVPITAPLAAKLKQAARGRAGDAPLLLQTNGSPWGRDGHDPSKVYRDDVRAVVASLGLDPGEVSAYSLRHSCIVRQLLRSVPVRVVASTCDTSVAMIERHYSKFIADFSDDISRAALLHHDAPAASDQGNRQCKDDQYVAGDLSRRAPRAECRRARWAADTAQRSRRDRGASGANDGDRETGARGIAEGGSQAA
jgi:integrase